MSLQSQHSVSIHSTTHFFLFSLEQVFTQYAFPRATGIYSYYDLYVFFCSFSSLSKLNGKCVFLGTKTHDASIVILSISASHICSLEMTFNSICDQPHPKQRCCDIDYTIRNMTKCRYFAFVWLRHTPQNAQSENKFQSSLAEDP